MAALAVGMARCSGILLILILSVGMASESALVGDRELKTTGSRPANPVPNPDESSLSHIKSQDMLADKVVDQWDDSDTENSSGSASYQVVPYKNVQGENNLPVLSKKRKFIISTYSVQCSTCKKWRVVPSKLKYEQIRENIIQVPFSCKYVHGWKPQVTCHDPTDISEDNGMAWAIDIPCIPQTPLGWERNITLRNEQSTRFADVYYISPAGIKIRSKKEVERYLEDNPDYAADLHLSQFSFKVPKPPNCPRHSELIEPTEVPPPVHEDPVHNYMSVPHGEANLVTHIAVTLALQVPVILSKKRKLNQ
ncbi:methyl-CpG-binding domain-containing protein 1-like [Triticum aestivum]|nr:methyl-CpG-binding domain-containing protein 1-like [Triticum aestivum]